MKNNDLIESILNKVTNGEAIEPPEAMLLMEPNKIPLSNLIQVSNTITRRNFGNKIDMCAIYAAKVGCCSGDCAFCSQSVHHKSDVKTINPSDIDDDEVIAKAKELYQLGIKHYSLVTSGEYLTEREFDKIIGILEKIRAKTKMATCASLGTLTVSRAKRLKAAGVSRYHHNIETSRSYFPKICSTHSYDDKIKTIAIARQAGLEVCCGGIISMGETARQRIEMAFAIKELDVTCVPINVLNPIAGTRLERCELLSEEEILRSIAVFRLILLDKPLRFAGGRDKALGDNEHLGYEAGINAMIVGDYLTTAGKSFAETISNLERAGYRIK